MRAGVWLECLARDFLVDLVVVPLYPAHASAPGWARSHADRSFVIRPDEQFALRSEDAQLLAELAVSAEVMVTFRSVLAHLAPNEAEIRVLDLDDIDWEREECLGRADLAEQELAKVRALAPRFTTLTTAALTGIGACARAGVDAPVVWVPNAAPAPASLPEATAAEFDLLFVGTLGYEPNAEGVRWLLDEVCPRLPGVRVAVVGASPPAWLRERADRDFTLAADVAEVESWYARARLAVVPIQAGSGTRIKLLEAWANGVPVVSTTLGAEGLDSDGSVLLADTAEAFAEACRKALDDPKLRARLIAAGHQRALEHSIDQVAQIIRSALHPKERR